MINCGRTKQIWVFTLDRHIYDSDFIICAEQEEQVHFIAAADNSVTDCSWKLSEISQNEFVLTEQAMSYRKILNETLASPITGNPSGS